MESRKIDVQNPRTGMVDYEFTTPSTADIQSVCARLKANQARWASLGVRRRIDALRRFGEAVESNKQAVIDALTIDTGRSILAGLELDYLPAMIERIASHAEEFADLGEPVPSQVAPIVGREQLVPYGLVLSISPWNFPVILSFIDTFPALAAGNAVIIKPSEVTPRWAESMRQILTEVPDIAEILEILPGDGETGAELIGYADAVAFTGSVRTGKKVAMAASGNFIPAFLELGGNDPGIVLESADVEYAANAIMCSALSGTGQACQSLERAYVARPVYKKFIDALVEEADKWSINYPDIEVGALGPFIFKDQSGIVAKHLQDAVEKGARIACGGEVIDHGGKWMRPTVVTDVSHDMLMMQEETFGPVITVMPFESAEEAIRLANDSIYGLSAAVFAANSAEAIEVAQHINAGAVSINDAHLTAFVHDVPHQSFGSSGLGASRFGLEGLTRFTRRKALMANDSGQALLPASTIFAEAEAESV